MPVVNVAMELHGAKQNLAFAFEGGFPHDFAHFKKMLMEVFEYEAALMLQRGQAPPQAHQMGANIAPRVLIEDIERYDAVSRVWVRVNNMEEVPDLAQLYVFQPHTEDDQGRIPPARPAPVLPPHPPQHLPAPQVGPTSSASTLPPSPSHGAAIPGTYTPEMPPQYPRPEIGDVLRSPGKMKGDPDIPHPIAPGGVQGGAMIRPRTLSPPSLHQGAPSPQPPAFQEYEGQGRHQMAAPHRPERVVCIVGVSQGSLAEALVRWMGGGGGGASGLYSYKVVAAGRDSRLLKALKTEFKEFHFYALDVLDAEGVDAFAARVATVHGAPHVVINAVGLSHAPASFEQTPAAVFDKHIDVIVKGTANLCRSLLGVMRAPQQQQHPQGYEGVFVNFSSNWGRTTVGGHSALCAAKWAVEGLTKSLAQELPANIACIPLNPGTVQTTGLGELLGVDRAADAISPQEWAALAMPFILSLSPRDTGRSLTCPGAPEHHYDNALQV